MRKTILLPLLLLASCTLLEPEEEARELRALTAAEQRIVETDQTFGLNLFRALNAEETGKNVFISPLSVSMALGMTMNGAEGETRAAMETALAKAGLTEDEINESYRSLIDLLTGLDPKVVFEIANAIWYREDFTVEPAFLDVNRTAFDAEIAALDFASPQALEVVNGWVNEKTHGKIETILDEIDPSIVMLLANAIYFKGDWRDAFDEDDTREAAFTNQDGSTSRVQLMHQESVLAYQSDENAQVVDLAYGDSLYSMTIVLPREGVDVDALAAGLDEATLDTWTENLRPSRVALDLPRFKLEYEKELTDVLSALGMGIAFQCGLADFARINRNGGLCISFVKHKTFVEVDEEGTEAAAVTVVGIERTSAPSYVEMRVDRPFLFLIRERHSGTLLFMGKVASL